MNLNLTVSYTQYCLFQGISQTAILNIYNIFSLYESKLSPFLFSLILQMKLHDWSVAFLGKKNDLTYSRNMLTWQVITLKSPLAQSENGYTVKKKKKIGELGVYYSPGCSLTDLQEKKKSQFFSESYNIQTFSITPLWLTLLSQLEKQR